MRIGVCTDLLLTICGNITKSQLMGKLRFAVFFSKDTSDLV